MDDSSESTQIEESFAHLADSDEEFFYFVNDEFQSVAGHSSLEDLAVYAFGSLEEALTAYAKRRNM